MSEISLLIIDDEAPARTIIRKYLEGRNDIRILGECENGFEALKAIQELMPDLILLDIQMPKITGFELLEILDKKPEIIFTTAYDQYAIKAFEMNAIDYLLKPFPKDRLYQAIDKAKTKLTSAPGAENLSKLQEHVDETGKNLERVVTRLGSKITVIPVEKIWYLESADDYVMVYSDLGNHLKEKTMKFFETHLPSNAFVRIHRSYIVSISQVVSVELYGKETHLVTLKSGAKLKASAEGYKRLREFF